MDVCVAELLDFVIKQLKIVVLEEDALDLLEKVFLAELKRYKYLLVLTVELLVNQIDVLCLNAIILMKVFFDPCGSIHHSLLGQRVYPRTVLLVLGRSLRLLER